MTSGRFRVGVVMHDFALGGTERIAARLATAWSGLGADVEIFCGNDAGPMRELLAGNVRVSAPSRPIHRGRRSVRRLGAAAFAHFDEHPVDAIFVPGNYHWRALPALAGLKPRPRIIVQISSALEKQQRGRLRQIWFEARMRRLLADADEIVTLSDETSVIARRILGRSKVATLALPALPDVDAPPVASPDTPPLVLGIGRLVPQKDFRTLVDAFAILAHPTARLAILGSGPQEAMIRARIRSHELEDRVTLVGYVPEIRPWLDRAHLFVLSSGHEGYGAVIIEALAAGRRVVATDCTPAATELLRDPSIGRVVPICDPAALASAMRAMLASPAPDPGAIAGHVKRFRIGPIARAYLDLMGYREAGDRSDSGGSH